MIYYERSGGVTQWLAEMANQHRGPQTETWTGVFDFRPDVIITSIVPELDHMKPPEAESVDGFKKNAADVLGTIREQLNECLLM